MTTAGKIAVGGAVVIGGFILYKMVSGTSVSKPATKNPTAPTGISGFISSVTSAFSYFGKTSPQPQAVPASGYAYGPTFANPAVDPNANIDPTTGGVSLPDNQVYGPPAPSTTADSTDLMDA